MTPDLCATLLLMSLNVRKKEKYAEKALLLHLGQSYLKKAYEEENASLSTCVYMKREEALLCRRQKYKPEKAEISVSLWSHQSWREILKAEKMIFLRENMAEEERKSWRENREKCMPVLKALKEAEGWREREILCLRALAAAAKRGAGKQQAAQSGVAHWRREIPLLR